MWRGLVFRKDKCSWKYKITTERGNNSAAVNTMDLRTGLLYPLVAGGSWLSYLNFLWFSLLVWKWGVIMLMVLVPQIVY